MSKSPFDKKLDRVRSGQPARVLDLFSGCGGISLGFHSAGFEISASVEFDPDAARTHGVNFHGGDVAHSKARDITVTHPQDLVNELGLGPKEQAFDVLVGGPPCQAFARVGRPKLREIDEHPEAFKNDPRAQLYHEYLRYIEELKPLAVLVENVPDVLNHGGQNIAEEICGVLTEKGYKSGYTLLNAAFYGVPQMRERMFLIALRKEIEADVSFPSPSHWVDLPQGYEGSRAVALKLLSGLDEDAHSYYTPPVASGRLPPAVTAEDALSDLPRINALSDLAAGRLKRGARRFDSAVQYPAKESLTPYAEVMRMWSGFEAPDDGVRDHVIRYLPRDYSIFGRMKPGDQYPEAFALANRMFQERLQELRAAGHTLKEGGKEYEELRRSMVPPYDAGKFPNKWRKMWRDQPARTLLAHLGKDSYSHIHYDSKQARTISVREAARLQSFPDGFKFSGTMNPAFRQIGNAVPPLMARALAMKIAAALKDRQSEEKGKIEDEFVREAAAV